METWKFGIIAAMLAGLVGFGLYNESTQDRTPEAQAATTTPTPSRYIGMSIVGQDLPEWSNVKEWVNTPKPVPLASLKGQVALIEVFRTECSHCQDAAPFMEALYVRYEPRGLKIVAIQSPGDFKNLENPETRWSDVQAWIKTRGLKYPIGFDEDSGWFQGKVSGKAETKMYPTILLTDKSGVVQFAHTGHDGEKAVSLAVAVEKALPSSKSLEERAENLAKWLAPQLQMDMNDDMQKKFSADLLKRLKK